MSGQRITASLKQSLAISANSCSLEAAFSLPLEESPQPIDRTFRLISSISAGSRGSGVLLLGRGGGEESLGTSTGGGEKGCIMSDSDREGEGAAIEDGVFVVGR